ncbi:unnamed protein product [Allacma fusca]|uniref:Uncharacterized protein n=1 Tax=Allacma fusca TaxID=39272 RepID=A0A8J2KCP7_9HEXA|nr:unnamed protein product [Allacma fusca]
MERHVYLLGLAALLWAGLMVNGIPVESSADESGSGVAQAQEDKSPSKETATEVQSGSQASDSSQPANSEDSGSTDDKILFPPLIGMPILGYVVPSPTPPPRTTQPPPPPPIIYIPPPGQNNITIMASGQTFNVIQGGGISQG